jgi:outer membrane protein TolC
MTTTVKCLFDAVFLTAQNLRATKAAVECSVHPGAYSCVVRWSWTHPLPIRGADVAPAATNSPEVTLAEAIALALRTSPDLAAAARELNIARAEIERANYTSQFNPYLDSLGDYRMRGGNSNSQDWRVGLAQELEIFGQPAARRKASQLGYERTRLEVENQARLLSAAVKYTFYGALRIRRQVELLSEVNDLDRRLLEDSRQARSARSKPTWRACATAKANGVLSRDANAIVLSARASAVCSAAPPEPNLSRSARLSQPRRWQTW